MRERVQPWTSVERSRAELRHERMSTIRAAVLGLQRSAGNAATTRLLQRAPGHTRYAPPAAYAISPEFTANHIGNGEADALNKHGDRGLHATNTVVVMTRDEACREIYDYLYALPVGENISNWTDFTFVTRNTYFCYETMLLDNETGRFQVREALATVQIKAWWHESREQFWLGHMFGIAAAKANWGYTREVQML